MRTRAITALATGAFIAGTGVASGAAYYFADVPEDHWARIPIEWASDNFIMTGPGGQERVFEPQKAVTRAELAAVSMRLYEKIREEEADVLGKKIMELEERLDLSSAVRTQPRAASTPPASTPPPAYGGGSRDTMPEMTFVPSEPVSFWARLMGSNEVPPVTTSGRGSLTMRRTERGLWYEVNVVNLSSPIVGAHFHSGRAGVNGPVIHEIVFNGMIARGYWENISTAQWSALVDDGIYVNVHTEDHPDGEIRGQVEFNR